MPDIAPVSAADPVFAPLLANPRMTLRRPPPSLALADLRRGANAFLARAPRPTIAAVEQLSDIPVPMRLYRPVTSGVLPLVLFFHGGGFVLGNLETHDAMCRSLAIAIGAGVVAVDYRLAPEHSFPAAHDDASDSLAWVVRHAAELDLDAGRIALSGDSAGGQLAVATALTASVRISHLGLFYPLLDPTGASESMATLGSGFMLTGSFLEWAWEMYGNGATHADERWDVTSADPRCLPPVSIVTAEFDPLRDEGEALARRLEQGNVPVRLQRFAGMIHGFVGLPQLTPAANRAIAFVADGIRAAFATERPQTPARQSI